MAYIGNEPAENYASFLTETFTVSATASYTLSHAVTNENEIRLVINGVVQQPGSGKAYTASGTTLTLSSATVSGDVMYAVYLGRALQTVNPPSGSVGTAQIADLAVTSGKLASGVLPTNTPAFHAYLSADQSSISGNTSTKVLIDTEVFDSNNNFASNRFTPQVAGQYFIYANVCGEFDQNKLYLLKAQIKFNGSVISSTQAEFPTDSVTKLHAYTSVIINMNGSSDYLEFFTLMDRHGGGSTTGAFRGGSQRLTYFGGYKIIT